MNRIRVPLPSWWMMPLIALLLFVGCAHHQPLPNETYQLVYRSDGIETRSPDRWSPAFVVYGHSKNHNRIGRPSVVQDEKGREKFYIDTQAPVVYFMKRTFKTEKAVYTNHIYRVHFPKVPYRLIPFNLTAGKNVGLMVVVTLNADGLPLLVTTVHTCGCYKAIVPTEYLPADALPKKWTGKAMRVYGEIMPASLEFDRPETAQIMVHVRPGVHRVMDLGVSNVGMLSDQRYRVIDMPTEPMSRLTALPTKTGTTSFFHSDGLLKGHVKGSVKPLETLFMSLISLDLFVGTDKAYADAAQTGNPFYTSLKPWRRNDSNMWHFERFLSYWGWRL